MMRQTLIWIMLGFPAAAAISSVWFGAELQRFADEVKVFGSTADLERFKSVVGRQMYAALAQVALLGLPFVAFLVGLSGGQLGVGDVSYVVIPSMLILVLGLKYRRVETKVRKIPAATSELEDARNAIIKTWLKKPLPDW